MGEFKRVSTAIVGCGMISRIYLNNLTTLFSIIDVKAVCDLDINAAKKRAEEFGISKVLTLDEICGDPEIELVINLTGPAAHYGIIKKLLLADKNVYTEKMMCFELEQGKELCKIAEERRLYFGTAPDTFLGAGLQTARKILDAGLIGTPTSCIAAINRNQSINSEIFKYIQGNGGAFAYDVGIYYVTALLALLGPVKKVTGFTAQAPKYDARFLYLGNYGKSWELPGSNLQTGVLCFENGVLGSIHFDGTSMDEEHPMIIIYGTEGILKIGNPDRFDGETRLLLKGRGECVIPFTHGFSGTPVYGPYKDSLTGGHRGLGAAEMAWSMRLSRKPRAGSEIGLHALEIILGFDNASDSGKTYEMTSLFTRPRPLPSGYLCEELGGYIRADAEAALTI